MDEWSSRWREILKLFSEMTKYKIFIEGSKRAETELRDGFRSLFERLGISSLVHIIACNDGNQAIADFLRHKDVSITPLLVIDSDEYLSGEDNLLQLLKDKAGKSLGNQIRSEQIDQYHFMVQSMESWIVAGYSDEETLSWLKNRDCEHIDKRKTTKFLEDRKKYGKTPKQYKNALIAVDAAAMVAKAPSFKRLIDRLKQ